MNAILPKAKEALLQGLDMNAGVVRAVLVDADATPYADTIAYADELAVVATSEPLTGKTFTGGVFDADDAVFTAVAGTTVEAIALIVDTGDPATSPVIAWLDDATGLPFVPSGGDITVVWANDATKIFQL